MHYVYIIYSQEFNRFYVGESVDPISRAEQHNTAFYNGASTSFAKDWTLILSVKVASRKDALLIEKYIKSMKSTVFISKLVNDDSFFKGFKSLVKQKFNIDIT